MLVYPTLSRNLACQSFKVSLLTRAARTAAAPAVGSRAARDPECSTAGIIANMQKKQTIWYHHTYHTCSRARLSVRVFLSCLLLFITSNNVPCFSDNREDSGNAFTLAMPLRSVDACFVLDVFQ